MRTSVVLVALSTALVIGACDSRPLPPEFIQTTTTSTTLPSGDNPVTTTVTLPPPEIRITGTVLGVTDGDTIKVLLDGATVDVRLLGINAPELAECWGAESQRHLSLLVENQEILLIDGSDGRDLDPFGRLLRYVYIETTDTPIHVNAAMVETGHAVGIQDGSDAAPGFKSAEARAFQSGYGMWQTFACGDNEGVGGDRPVVRVSELAFDPEGPDETALGDEFVTIINEGYDVVEISGWTLRDESTSNRFTFGPNIILDPGEQFTVVTGCDGGPAGSTYWCSDQAVWSNGGDTAIVMDTLGNAVVWYTYTASTR